MLTLDLSIEPYWLDMPHDVRVEIRPVTTAVMAAAQAAASQRLGTIRATSNDLDPDIAAAFWDQATRPVAAVAAEGNG